MSNIEVMYSIYFKKAERSETILQHSAVQYSIFCGSLFQPCEISHDVSRREIASSLKKDAIRVHLEYKCNITFLQSGIICRRT